MLRGSVAFCQMFSTRPRQVMSRSWNPQEARASRNLDGSHCILGRIEPQQGTHRLPHAKNCAAVGVDSGLSSLLATMSCEKTSVLSAPVP